MQPDAYDGFSDVVTTGWTFAFNKNSSLCEMVLVRAIVMRLDQAMTFQSPRRRHRLPSTTNFHLIFIPPNQRFKERSSTMSVRRLILSTWFIVNLKEFALLCGRIECFSSILASVCRVAQCHTHAHRLLLYMCICCDWHLWQQLTKKPTKCYKTSKWIKRK